MGSKPRRSKKETLYVLSSTPVRRGDVYCSEACGAQCRFEEFARVRDEAKELRRLLGAQWKVTLSENLGWHATVRHELGRQAYIAIHRSSSRLGKPSYWVEFNGQRIPQATADGGKPEVALRRLGHVLRQWHDSTAAGLNVLAESLHSARSARTASR